MKIRHFLSKPQVKTDSLRQFFTEANGSNEGWAGTLAAYEIAEPVGTTENSWRDRKKQMSNSMKTFVWPRISGTSSVRHQAMGIHRVKGPELVCLSKLCFTFVYFVCSVVVHLPWSP